MEAQNIANSGWNYTSASSFITLSFWVKSSVAQDFKGYVRTLDGTSYGYPFATGSLTADTWTKITKTIPGNSNLQVDNNNENGLELNLLPYLTTSYTDNSVTENAWAAFASGTRAKDTPSTWWTTNDATFEITGVQLEVGSVATDFEHRSFGQELALCQRYYFEVSGDFNDYLTDAFAQATSNVFANFYSPVPMRANPTFTGNAKAVRFYSNDQSADYDLNGMVIQHANTTVSRGGCTLIVIVKTGASSMTAGQGGLLRSQQDGATAQFSAEL